MRIISLLEQKNHYLEKFYSINETEILNFSAGDFQKLDAFYDNREQILEMIRYIDAELAKLEGDTDSLNADQKRQVATSLAIKEEYVARILAQDLEILSCIEKAKSGIIRELQEVRKARKAVGGYKSKAQNSSRRLDEEV